MRFATAQDVVLAFPHMAHGFQSPLDATPSAAYLDGLVAEGRLPDAVSFIAHLLPRREAVWWAIKCVRLEPQAFDAKEEPLIAAAENWARAPSESLRKDALALGDAATDMTRPAGWLARAAGWSGGAMVDTGTQKVMSTPDLCPAAVRGAVLLAASASPDPMAFMRTCVNEASELLKRVSGE